ADVVVLAVPSIGIEQQLEDWGDRIGDDATLVSLIKGVDVATRRFGSQVIADTLGCDPDRVVVVSARTWRSSARTGCPPPPSRRHRTSTGPSWCRTRS